MHEPGPQTNMPKVNLFLSGQGLPRPASKLKTRKMIPRFVTRRITWNIGLFFL